MISEANPVFVKIERYKEIIELLDVIDKKTLGTKQLLSDIESLKAQEDEQLAEWQKNIDEIDHKLENLRDQLSQ